MTPISDSIRDLFSRSRLATLSHRRERAAAALVALCAGVAVFALASELFPYHSSNDDEAVYLLQAAMLLEGQLEIHAGELADAFRPWFFVEDGGRLYPRYSPVPAAMYAISMALFGEPRVTLAIVAAANAALVYVLGSTVFDRRVGVVAAGVFAASPMALLATSVFLPYAPTTLLNLCFAVWYLRGVRSGRLRHAVLAGTAIGLAFFARPYTAVLFAAPFIGHALWTLLRSVRDESTPLRPLPDPIRRNAVTAAVGLLFVGLALAYNARLTGSPLLFPFQAFAPLDGPGFGYRQLRGHAVEYTPSLAVRANGYVLRYFLTRWFAAGAVGTVAALAGLALAARRWRGSGTTRDADSAAHDRTAGVLLAGLLLTVPLGNVAFWGNYNVLATMTDPTDGLLAQFGPVYHFDILVPLSIFAAFGLVAGWRRLRDGAVRDRLEALASPRSARAIALAVLVASALVVGAANAALLSAPIERNAAHTDRLETAYEPFEEADLEDALVFQPTPYGQWQNHPFQALRNDPGLDGETVYALEGPPERDFAVLDAYPDREYYRYTYHGEWGASPDDLVPTLQLLTVREGESFEGETVVGLPERVDRATVRLETADGNASYRIDDPDDRIAVEWGLESSGADGGVARLNASEADSATVPFEEADEVVLTVTLVQETGVSATFTYRQETAVRATADGLEAIRPSERTACRLVEDCGTEGTYLPDESTSHAEWVTFETGLEPDG
ncbi:ArnT family glycosyltransferase [Natronococcus jeotgali]|uniref:Uncharacterized protein n=1 Tax=Natronococcus jeotgali DSM 18795 TaxID=1227498 RepID=L9XV33_9EURY|nr:glycosyltransferase family 39 protein [Natronococcus jeotgali]ELY65610.1 hypothetical protein C492_02984 [Natronococcus jeotgali DSM 18795]